MRPTTAGISSLSFDPRDGTFAASSYDGTIYRVPDRGLRPRTARNRAASGGVSAGMERVADEAVGAVHARWCDASAEYGDRLANHLPMALSALAAMGASRARLEAFAERYAATHALRPAEPDERASRAGFARRLAAEGRAAVLAAELPRLLPGAAASAFHGAIRTAYALDRDDGELAAALAFWSRTYLPLGVAAGAAGPFGGIAAALEPLRGVRAGFEPTGLIFVRMERVAAEPAFARALVAAPPAAELRSLAVAAAAALGATRGFVALHAMTATHALRVLLPWVPDPDAAVAAFWPAYAAAYVIAGAPAPPSLAELAARRTRAPARWDDVLAAALASDDDHVVKAVFTARAEERAYGEPLFRWAAARYVTPDGPRPRP